MHLGSPTSVKKARVEIIPLIDVMFFLLAAFMMVTLTMNRLRTLQMDLPSAVAPKSSEKPDMMEIVIDREGDLKVAGKLLRAVPEGVELEKTYGITADVAVPVIEMTRTKASFSSRGT